MVKEVDSGNWKDFKAIHHRLDDHTAPDTTDRPDHRCAKTYEKNYDYHVAILTEIEEVWEAD